MKGKLFKKIEGINKIAIPSFNANFHSYILFFTSRLTSIGIFDFLSLILYIISYYVFF